jgi:two-component system nitrate/nitrite response regulator NarL
MNRVEVVLADDHPVYLDGLHRALANEPDLTVLDTVADGRSALDAIRRRRPAVAVLDLKLPEIDGVAVIDAVRREHLPTHVLVVSALHDSGVVYRAIELGARGFVPKLVGGDRIVAAIRAVARGETVLPPELTAGLAEEIRRRRADDRPVLTPRELDILRLAADGCSNAQIACQLHISVGTVKTHLQHAFEKLEVADRAAAVARAIRLGLLV